MFCKTVADKTVKHVQSVVAALESCPLGRHKYKYLSTLVTLTASFFLMCVLLINMTAVDLFTKSLKLINDRSMDNTVK